MALLIADKGCQSLDWEIIPESESWHTLTSFFTVWHSFYFFLLSTIAVRAGI